MKQQRAMIMVNQKNLQLESLRNLAREAQSHLQTACDPQIYLAIYCQVKETAIQMRNDRKVERSVMVCFSSRFNY